MPPEYDPNNSESSGAAASAPQGARPERRLGRGLEDISHLFSSASAHATAPIGQTPDRPPDRAQVEEETQNTHRTVVLRRQPQVSRDRLADALMEFAGELEEGLRGLDAKVPCEGRGEIDVVAVDRLSRLVLIDFELTVSDALLLHGMGHFDWAVRNTGNLRRMYRGRVIDFGQEPRLFLIAPAFSPLVRQAARYLACPQIVWKRYIAVDLPAGTGFLFEDVP